MQIYILKKVGFCVYFFQRNNFYISNKEKCYE